MWSPWGRTQKPMIFILRIPTRKEDPSKFRRSVPFRQVLFFSVRLFRRRGRRDGGFGGSCSSFPPSGGLPRRLPSPTPVLPEHIHLHGFPKPLKGGPIAPLLEPRPHLCSVVWCSGEVQVTKKGCHITLYAKMECFAGSHI